VNQQQYNEAVAHRDLHKKADMLFIACMQFLICKEPEFLVTIRNLSQQLIDQGYESRFEHRRRALVLRHMMRQLDELVVTEAEEQLLPRQDDLEALPNADV
jgi:hypothetical protein